MPPRPAPDRAATARSAEEARPPGRARALGSRRPLPDFAVRLAARFRDPSLREITPALGRRNRHSAEKARRVLGREPRPAREAVLDCARSLIAQGAV